MLCNSFRQIFKFRTRSCVSFFSLMNPHTDASCCGTALPRWILFSDFILVPNLKSIIPPKKLSEVFWNSVSVLPRYLITKFEKFDSQVCILTPRCAFWLLGVMHTAELYSAVWCTPRSLTPWCDAHRTVLWEIWVTWLRSVMHTAESDYFEYVLFWIRYIFNYVLSKNVLGKKDSLTH